MTLNKSSLRVRYLAFFCFSLFVSGGVSAAALGKLNVYSALGQPLRAEVEVMATPEESDSLTVTLASVDAYRQARVEMNPTLYSVRLAIEQRGDKRIVRITSPRAVDDPFLEVMLELNSNVSRVVKNYAILLDPAPLEREQAVVSLGDLGAKSSAAKAVAEPVREKIKEIVERKEKSTEKIKPTGVKRVDVAPVKKVKKVEKAVESKLDLDKKTEKVVKQDKLVLSKTTVDPTSGKVGGLTVEDKIASDKAITDANTRIQELEKNLNDLRKMMEVQNRLFVEQQKMNESLRTGKPSGAPVADSLPEQQKNTSGVLGWTLFALLLLGAGGGGAYYYRRIRQGGGNSGGEEGGLTAEMMRILNQYRSEPTVNPVKSSSDVSSQSNPEAVANNVATDKEMDPITEADFYSTSGDSERAEGVLKSFLRIQPDNTAVRMKLLDIYGHRKDVRAFGDVAAEFYKLSKGEGREWADVVALGKTLDPDNPLYQLKTFVDSANADAPESRAKKEEALDFYAQASLGEHEAHLEPPAHLSSPDTPASESPHLVDFQAKLKDINFDFLDDLDKEGNKEGNKEAEKKKKEDDQDDNSIPFFSDKKGS